MTNLPIIYVSTNRSSTFSLAAEQAAKRLALNTEKKSAEEATHPDLLIIRGETSIGIEQIQKLVHHVSRKPYQSQSIVTIIHPGESMTTEAQNALLKTLEEPPSYVHIFITTTHAANLLPTIQSRSKIIFLDSEAETSEVPVDILELLNKPLQKRLEIIDEILKTQKSKRSKDPAKAGTKEIERWLDQWILDVRTTDPKLLKRLIKAKKLLKSNVTPQHTLDSLVMHSTRKNL